MIFNLASPIHETTPNEQPNDPSSEALAEKIVVVVLGAISTLGTFFAVLILGAPISFAASIAILIGGSISLITYSTFQDQKNHPDPIIGSEFQKIQQEIDKQLQLNAEFNKQLREQDARQEIEIATSIQEAVKKFKQAKAELDLKFSTQNLEDPSIRTLYEVDYRFQLFAFNSILQSAFMKARLLLSDEAKARVLAPYQAEYFHLM